MLVVPGNPFQGCQFKISLALRSSRSRIGQLVVLAGLVGLGLGGAGVAVELAAVAGVGGVAVGARAVVVLQGGHAALGQHAAGLAAHAVQAFVVPTAQGDGVGLHLAVRGPGGDGVGLARQACRAIVNTAPGLDGPAATAALTRALAAKRRWSDGLATLALLNGELALKVLHLEEANYRLKLICF
jgi:hypothetical protein